MGYSIGDIFFALRGDGAQLQTDVQKQGDAAGQTLGQRFGASFGPKAKLAMIGAGAAVGDFVAQSTQDFARFEQGMNEVFSLMPGMSKDAMGAMMADVKELSNETGKLPEEIIPALYQSISAGVPSENVFEFLRTANMAAVGGVADTKDAVNLLSAVTKGYGDTSQEASVKASDLATMTVRLGQTSFPELAASMGKTIPVAAALGMSQEDLFAGFATLTGVTGNTAEVSTQLAAVYKGLLNPSADMEKALEAIGFQTGAAAIESLGFQGTLMALRETTGGSDAQLAKMLGTSEALTAVLAITGSQVDVFNEKQEQMGEAAQSNGAVTKEAYDQIDQGVAATASRITAKLKTFVLGVGEFMAPLGPLFMAFGPQMGRWIGRGLGGVAGFLAPKLGSVLKSAWGLATKGLSLALGPLTDAISGGFTGIGAAVTNSRAFQAAGKFMGSSLGKLMMIGATVALLAMIPELWGQMEAEWDRVRQSKETNEANREGFLTRATRADVEGALEALRAMPDQMEMHKRLLFDIDAGGVKTHWQEQINAMEAWLADPANQPGPVEIVPYGPPAPGTMETIGADAAEDVVRGAEENNAATGARWVAMGQHWVARMSREGLVAAYEAGVKLTENIGRGMAEASRAVISAMDDLRWILENGLTPAQQVAQIKGKEWIQDFQKGMTSEIPGAREAAINVGLEALSSLSQVAIGDFEAKRIGEIMTQLYAAGLTEQEVVAALAASGVGEEALQNLAGVTGWNPAGVTQISQYAAGIASQEGAAGNAGAGVNAAARGAAGDTTGWHKSGQGVGGAWMDGLRFGIVNKKGQLEGAINRATGALRAHSPPKEGPLRKIDKWGTSVARAWWQPFVGEILSGLGPGEAALGRWGAALSQLGAELAGPQLAHALPAMSGPGSHGLLEAAALSPALGSLEPREGAEGGLHIGELNTYGLPMRAETPLEVVDQLRRAVRTGNVAPPRPQRWKVAPSG